jgi:hypothetical protein
MNGRITIELAGEETGLTFGMLAVEEFGTRQAIGNTGWAKLMTDLVYAGYCNEEILNGINPKLTYRDVADAVEELILSKDPILQQVYKCFESSRAGADMLDSVKKKMEEEEVSQKVKPKAAKSKAKPAG